MSMKYQGLIKGRPVYKNEVIPSPTASWEIEFRKRFGYENLVGYERERFENQEEFISSTIQKEREKLMGKVVSLITCTNCNGAGQMFGHNLGITECPNCGGDGHCLHDHDGENIIEVVASLAKEEK